MRPRAVLSVLIYLSAALGMSANQSTSPQVTIEDTGSTNMAGVKMTVDAAGNAEVHPAGAEMRKSAIDTKLCDRLFADLNSIGPLSALPAVHCAKSVSFGSSLYVKFNGERSPDLNCPAPAGSKLADLQKDVRDLMAAAHATQHSRKRVYTATAK